MIVVVKIKESWKYLDLAHRTIVFIRFNPDAYFKATKKILSCWGVNGNGICCVKKSKRKNGIRDQPN